MPGTRLFIEAGPQNELFGASDSRISIYQESWGRSGNDVLESRLRNRIGPTVILSRGQAAMNAVLCKIIKLLKLHAASTEMIIAAIALPTACGIYSVGQGADIIWDLRNYHLYNPFAAYHGRYMLDVAPAQVQSYLNPLLDFPFYAAVQLFNDRPRLIAFLMGTVHGLNLLALTLLAWHALGSIGISAKMTRRSLTLAALAIGATGAGSAPLIGATSGDLTSAVPVLIGLYFLLRGVAAAAISPRDARRDLIVAGGLAGLGVGAKLTMGPYGVAMAAALIVLPRSFCISGFTWFVAGGVAGALLTGGCHHLRMLWLFGNPLFPMMNNVFLSPYWEYVAMRDTAFLPKTAFDAVFRPFEWAMHTTYGIVSELAFRDIRMALSLSLGVLVLAGRGLSRIGSQQKMNAVPSSLRALLIFGLVAYSIWLLLFSIYRYLLPLELLSGLFIVLALGSLVGRAAWIPTALGATIACIVTTVPLHWGHQPFGEKYIQVLAPVLPPDTLVVLVDGEPVSYLIPFFEKDTIWISLNNNFLRPNQNNLLVRRGRDLISSHKGPLMVLDTEDTYDAPVPQALSAVLAAFDLETDNGNCLPVSSNLARKPYQLCPIKRLRSK